MIYEEPIFRSSGDQALLVELGDEINPEVNRLVHHLANSLKTSNVNGIVAIIPGFNTLLIQYDVLILDLPVLRKLVIDMISQSEPITSGEGRLVELPVLYGGEFGPDLERVSDHSGVDSDRVVEIHSATNYLVYMIGFTPGFPYLGGLDEKIATPRISTPKQDIPAGSVGIAESQTGVYPVSTPGGWNIIGRTPLPLFEATRSVPSLLMPGDYVRFVPLDDLEDYQRLVGEISVGENPERLISA